MYSLTDKLSLIIYNNLIIVQNLKNKKVSTYYAYSVKCVKYSVLKIYVGSMYIVYIIIYNVLLNSNIIKQYIF